MNKADVAPPFGDNVLLSGDRHEASKFVICQTRQKYVSKASRTRGKFWRLLFFKEGDSEEVILEESEGNEGGVMCGYLGEGVPGRANSKCKDPGVGA